jgi:DNA-binding NarL/FixJ family response regulator
MSTPETGRIRILVVDDLDRVREGLRTMLELVDDLEWVGQAANGPQAIQLADQLEPDLVLMDFEMPEMDGLEATQRIKARRPRIGVVMLTIHEDPQVRERAARVGVDAFVAKGASFETLLATIRHVWEDSSRSQARH